MKDTTPEFEKRVRERFLALAPAERVSMCADMLETARALVEASLPAGLDPIERRWRICRRFYGDLADKVFPRPSRPFLLIDHESNRRTTMNTSKRTALLGFFMASLAAPAMAAEGEGAAAAVAPEKPSGEPTKMFIEGGIGPALNPRYKVNGKTITFSSRGPRTRYLPSP